MDQIFATFIGNRVIEQLIPSMQFVVWGNTSKGVFIKRVNGGIIFLSYEKYRGPLTINIPGEDAAFSDIQPGEEVQYSKEDGQTFKTEKAQICLDHAVLWAPEDIPMTNNGAFLWNNLDKIKSWLQNEPNNNLLWKSSFNACDGPTSDLIMNDNLSSIIKNVYRSLRAFDSDTFMQNANSIIGLGSGLTPSGDDFLSGMALAISRYSNTIHSLEKFLPWFLGLIPFFSKKTTILSTDLFNASITGSNDERLINGFDSLFKNGVTRDEVLTPISSWGSSSGFDALSGFYVLMRAVQP